MLIGIWVLSFVVASRVSGWGLGPE
jgi:hypothetical protein